MKAYLATTGLAFGLIVAVHLLRVFHEPYMLHDGMWIVITGIAAALCIWAVVLLRRLRRT